MLKRSWKGLWSVVLASSLIVGCSNANTNTKEKEDGEYKIATVRWSDWGDDFLKGNVLLIEHC